MTTKADIRSQFKALLNRNDCTDALANVFIDQTIARMQRTLRVPSMEKALTITFTEEMPDSFVLPNDYLGMKSLYFVQEPFSKELEHIALGRFLEISSLIGSVPQYYTRVQNTIKVKPAGEGMTIYMVYYGEIPDLVEDTDENFITVIAPDLLIYGALSFACDYFVDERKGPFEERYRTIYAEIEEQNYTLEFSGGMNMIQPLYSYND